MTVTTTLLYCYFCYHSKHNTNKENIFTDDIVQKDNDCCQSDTDLTSVFQVPAKMVVTKHDVCMASHLSAHSTEVLSHAHLASSSGKLWTKSSLFLSGVPPAEDWNPHWFICLQDLLIIENSYRWPYICWKTHFTKNSQKRQKEEKTKNPQMMKYASQYIYCVRWQ